MSGRRAAVARLWRVLLLAGLFMMLVQIHRASGAVIAAELAARGLTPSDIATVVSALFLAAAVFQLPTGILFDRHGARATLAGMGLVGVAGIVVFALSDGVVGLTLGRFLIGLGHGGAMRLGETNPHFAEWRQYRAVAKSSRTLRGHRVAGSPSTHADAAMVTSRTPPWQPS